MAIGITDKFEPKNGGKFALMDAKDIEMPDGSRLADLILKPLTEDEYEALEAAGKIDEKTLYLIVESDGA